MDQNWQSFLRGAWTHQTWPGHTAIIVAFSFVSKFGYLAAFSNADDSQSSKVSNYAKFRTFWPLWKLGEMWARSLYQLLKLYLRPNLWNTFNGHPLRGCWARWIDKSKKEKSSLVKLKAFPSRLTSGGLITLPPPIGDVSFIFSGRRYVVQSAQIPFYAFCSVNQLHSFTMNKLYLTDWTNSDKAPCGSVSCAASVCVSAAFCLSLNFAAHITVDCFSRLRNHSHWRDYYTVFCENNWKLTF